MKLLLLLALSGAASPPAQQFDLVCTGTIASLAQPEPATRHYRVDLKAGKWCANGDNDQCVTRPIAETEPDMIWFERHPPQYPGDPKILHYVSRTTGHWYWLLGPMETEGTCNPEPFSGFPDLKTRF